MPTTFSIHRKFGRLVLNSNNKNVVGLYDVTGQYDAIVIAKFKDTDELDKFLKELLKSGCIEKTITQTVLNIVKEDIGSANIL